jgi:hypothetical protein
MTLSKKDFKKQFKNMNNIINNGKIKNFMIARFLNRIYRTKMILHLA